MKDHEVAEWLIVSEDDAHSAFLLNEGKELRNSLYHITQSVEKYLKTYLIANNIKVNYNHNISETLDKCINHNSIFNNVFDECTDMTSVVNKLRYPKMIPITEKHIKDGFELIDKIKSLKPIQDLYSYLNEKYGGNWRNVLFENVLTVETGVSS